MKRKLTMAMAFGVFVLFGAVRADELVNELERCNAGIETFNEVKGGMMAVINDEGRSPAERCGAAGTDGDRRAYRKRANASVDRAAGERAVPLCLCPRASHCTRGRTLT